MRIMSRRTFQGSARFARMCDSGQRTPRTPVSSLHMHISRLAVLASRGSYIFSFSQFLPSVTASLALCCSLVWSCFYPATRCGRRPRHAKISLYELRRRGRTPVESAVTTGTAPGARRFQSRRGCAFLKISDVSRQPEAEPHLQAEARLQPRIAVRGYSSVFPRHCTTAVPCS